MNQGPISSPTRVPESAYPSMSSTPHGFDRASGLPPGLLDVLGPLHREFTPRQQQLVVARKKNLEAAHRGRLPGYLPPSRAANVDWSVELPDWCRDQRNQMTGPADDAELVVKMLNAGAPGVMLDLEDSVVNEWEHLAEGTENIPKARSGALVD